MNMRSNSTNVDTGMVSVVKAEIVYGKVQTSQALPLLFTLALLSAPLTGMGQSDNSDDLRTV